MNLQKKFMAYERLQLNLPLFRHTSQYAFSFPLSERTYFMDDPKRYFLKEIYC